VDLSRKLLEFVDTPVGGRILEQDTEIASIRNETVQITHHDLGLQTGRACPDDVDGLGMAVIGNEEAVTVLVSPSGVA
jgi:hypothetical protein